MYGVTAKSIVYISSSFLHEMVKRKVVVGFPFSRRIKHILQHLQSGKAEADRPWELDCCP